MPVPAYDLATLRRARHRWGLHVAGGLAVTHDWVARAEEGVCATEAAEGRAVSYYRDPVPRASYRATRRALLEELQRYVDEHPPAPAAALAADPAVGTGETAWYVAPDSGLRLSIPAACSALVGAGDRLLAVWAYGKPYVAVMRGGTVMAAILGRFPAAAARPLAALPAIRRRYVQAVTRHRAEPR